MKFIPLSYLARFLSQFRLINAELTMAEIRTKRRLVGNNTPLTRPVLAQ